ncbi:protein of unknown function [Tepidanaerobacter acetatoxydans Re1]|uniref:Uncharacterized protein n=1 Tax=Tepidanaerobacter acetatoxydans (strain DSM 21804 / JCM 16047 / Re1) TaxID=1209989 RepID=L0S6U0_TEPAE|nr:protein of unknown function [Tepidanaerobacter acetatoxydans Re1]
MQQRVSGIYVKIHLKWNGILFLEAVSHIILLDIIFKRIYEGSITGKLTDKRSSILKQ